MRKSEIKVPFETAHKSERETTVNRYTSDNFWDLYTSEPKVYRDLVAKGHKPYREDKFGAFFCLPTGRISFLRAKSPLTKGLSQPISPEEGGSEGKQ